MSALPAPLDDRLRMLQLLAATIAGGALLVAVARVLVDTAAPWPSWWQLALVVLALLGSALLIRQVGYAVPALPDGLPDEHAAATSVRYFSSTTVLRAAICEVPIFVALFVSILPPRTWLPLVLAVPGAAALFWTHAWPSERTVTAVAEGLERAGARSHLAEALGLRGGVG
ncbi:MAG: hypothetical protein L0H79_18010 [Intrasporangium sp.]|uniref:hypothetical protein n=1 Tax=Intrasporangium sp. TaxID=1925024 RepID=UPI002648841B|nr:hypothetical protein [Intrasporangium sp.]MDN5797623.1 hypothetical protein [Intrasporangium sp.]